MTQINNRARLAVGVLLFFYTIGLAQQKPPNQKPKDIPENIPKSRPIQIDSSLVPVSVTVTDPLNRSVVGLEKENFHVFEDKVEQKIAYFSNEDVPIIIGIVFDTSGSMGEKLIKSVAAVRQFLKVANPEDEFFLVQFNDSPTLTVGSATEAEKILQNLMLTKPHGRTALIDAIYMAISHVHASKATRKALLVISDGGDNHSRFSEDELKNMVREADVQIYAIGIFEPIQGRSRTPEELSGPGLLTQISEWTGGRHYPIQDMTDLPDVAQKIGTELRNQYVLYYRPENKARDGKYRKIKVELSVPSTLPALRAHFRQGYYAPY